MVDPAIKLLRAVAHPLRYAILDAVADKERNVGEIEARTGISQPTLSQQLSILRGAGLVKARRDGRMVFYSVAQAAIERAIACMDALLPERQAGLPSTPSAANPLTGAAVFARLD